MQVDFAVELGPDDDTLEFPWAAPNNGLRYYNLKRRPEAVGLVEEADRCPELKEFLAAVNAPTSLFETAKCDAWGTTEINPEEEIFGAPWKFGSYVDFVFTNPPARHSFEDHEKLLKAMTDLLKRVPEIPASAEFLLRRCFFREGEAVREGFYVTFYLFGYGSDEATARHQWGIGMRLVGNAIVQLYSRHSSV
jgi:hypothetical protein